MRWRLRKVISDVYRHGRCSHRTIMAENEGKWLVRTPTTAKGRLNGDALMGSETLTMAQKTLTMAPTMAANSFPAAQF